MKQEGPYIGIDVAKAHLDLAVHLSGEPWRVTNDDAGINAVVTHFRELHPTLIVVEPRAKGQVQAGVRDVQSLDPVTLAPPHCFQDPALLDNLHLQVFFSEQSWAA